ncbi:unnamed protein product [Somion occarium]|uniref:Fungal-type protein kinase domain-containing protein n=1 Tax=Somion occarium TaxID=3059160 RepID=A0ABP1CSI0_9APHY
MADPADGRLPFDDEDFIDDIKVEKLLFVGSEELPDKGSDNTTEQRPHAVSFLVPPVPASACTLRGIPNAPARLLRTVAFTPPTPIKRGLSSIKEKNEYKNEALVNFLKSEYSDKIDTDYDIEDFVRHVWKFDAKTIPTKIDYQLRADACSDFLGGQYVKKNGKITEKERACCTHFVKVLSGLFGALRKNVDRAQQVILNAFSAKFMFLFDRTIAGDYAHLKPDIGYTPKDLKLDEQAWELLGLFGEMKKRSVQTHMVREKYPIDLGQLRKVRRGARTTKKMATAPDRNTTTPPTHPMVTRSIDKTGAAEDGSRRAISARSTTKRKSRDIGVDHHAEGPVQKKLRDSVHPHPVAYAKSNETRMTNTQAQVVKYLNELLSHGIRQYSTGFLIEDTKVTLWYSDRMGIVKSKSFDFILEPHYLLLMVAGIAFADRHRLGCCPLIEWSPRHLLDYRETTLKLPHALDAEDVELKDLEFKLDVNRKREVKTAYGAIGRGTTIVPLKARGAAAALFGSGNLVAKMAWQPVNRVCFEDQVVKVVRKKLRDSGQPHLKNMLKHITDLKCSLTLNMDDPLLGLPRGTMELPDPYELRLFKVLIIDEYLPLQFVDSLDEFKRIMRHVVEAEVLHRDVSNGNVMFYRLNDGSVMGVLSDWDLSTKKDGQLVKNASTAPVAIDPIADASRSDAEGDMDALLTQVRYRTGTGPFMALDLLVATETPLHLYRHDLESFFYVMVWFSAVFNPKTHELGYLEAWEQSSLKVIGTAKKDFLKESDEFERILRNVHHSFLPLISSWLSPLYEDFGETILDAVTAMDKIRQLQSKIVLARKRPGPNTEAAVSELEKRIKEMEEKHDGAQSALTYERFMAILVR